MSSCIAAISSVRRILESVGSVKAIRCMMYRLGFMTEKASMLCLKVTVSHPNISSDHDVGLRVPKMSRLCNISGS